LDKGLCGLFACCLIGIVLVPVTSGETVQIGRLPLKPSSAAFVMTVNMEVVAGNGYQPLDLKFSPRGKTFNRDHRIEVVIEPRYPYRTELDYEYRRSITLPEGSAAHTVPVYVPHYFPCDEIFVSLYEDGRAIEPTPTASFSTIRGGLRTRFADQKTSVGIIAPSDAAIQDAAWKVYPDVRTLLTVFGEGPLPEDVKVDRLTHKAARDLAKQVQPASIQFRSIDESNLQQHWLGYSQLDVIIVAAPVLQRIEQQQPDKFEHLKNWLAAGGNFWVYACQASDGSFVSKLKMDPTWVGKVLRPKRLKSTLDLTGDNDTSELIYERWNGIQRESQQYSYRGNTTLSDRKDIYEKLEKEKHTFVQTVPVNQIAAGITIGSFGLGTVVAIASEDPFPGSYQFWKSIEKIFDNGQLVWTERMGIDVPRGNDNYWMWLISSVGQPPVKSFVLLNTLFVILVGPFCYYFFRRRGRLYLLYFFAPCMAFLVTLSLFAYALAADGTKTKVRSRQLTWIDRENGYAIGQSRQTYYAVLGSGGGITLSSDAAVYPVRNTPAYNRYYRQQGRSSRRGDYSVSENSQQFSGSFLPARNQVQYLITHPIPMEQALEFSFTSGVTVTNQSPYTLKRLVVCDANRSYWEAENLVAGKPTSLKPSNSQTVSDLIGPDVIPPLGTVPMLQNNLRRWGGPGTGIQVSLLETRLQEWATKMPPRTFVATAELVEDRLGVEGATIVDSVHVVMGEIP
jgi:hypothetical protein